MDDRSPEVVLEWPEPQELSGVRLFFDTDADHAMESVQMGHHESVMPCCYRGFRIFSEDGREVAHAEDNHQTVVTAVFAGPVRTSRLSVVLTRPEGDVCPGLMGILIL